jgi:hypothetical protein
MNKKTQNKTRGRPSKPVAELRRNRVNINYTDLDFALIKQVQEQHGFPYPADAVHWMSLQYGPALKHSYDVFQTHVDSERIRESGKRNGLTPAQIDGMVLSLLSPHRASDKQIVYDMEEME